uniref:Activin_recp domain-containing protein n=1 Tax=Rhabditophanes sp. KR3021 TaxID=114890 RepID=A0AC35UEI5_9BILA
MKFILFIISFQIAFGLKCDKYMDYQVDGQRYSSNNPFSVTERCQACGFYESNEDNGKTFKGVYIGCLDTATLYARSYGSQDLNVTEFQETCNKNLESNTAFCSGATIVYNEGKVFTTQICCCNKDYCSRGYANKLRDNFVEY